MRTPTLLALALIACGPKKDLPTLAVDDAPAEQILSAARRTPTVAVRKSIPATENPTTTSAWPRPSSGPGRRPSSSIRSRVEFDSPSALA